MLNAEAERLPEPPKETGPNLEALSLAAADLGRRLVWLPGTRSSQFFSERYRALCRAIRPVLRHFHGPPPKNSVGDDYRWLNDNLRLLHAELRGTKEGFKLVRKLPHVRTPDGAIAPRVVALAAGFLATSGYDFSENTLVAYVQAFQQNTVSEDGGAVGTGSSAEAGPAGRDRRPRIESGGGPSRFLRGGRLRTKPARYWPHFLEECSRTAWSCSIAFCARTPPAPTLAWILRAAIFTAPRSRTSRSTPI